MRDIYLYETLCFVMLKFEDGIVNVEKNNFILLYFCYLHCVRKKTLKKN
jgi:hypothetical protein